MFDKLIVSEPEGADFKNRRNYFMVSSVAVGLLFLAAVVASIYASDYGLGHNGLELVEMVAPPNMTPTEPELPRPQTPASPSHSASQLPMRQVNMVNINENPIVPTAISTAQNSELQRPETGRFTIGRFNTEASGNPGVGTGRTSGGNPELGGLSQTTTVSDTERETAPPTVKPIVNKPAVVRSEGVMNGKATSLPKPLYSAAAKAVGAQGTVSVQITVDEAGNVISANAVSGHPLLKAPAEQAARNAKFSITYLSRVPVKVTGIIVYNFIR